MANTEGAVMTVANLAIADIKVRKRHRRLNQGKVMQLAESIGEIGLRSPISVTDKSVLIAGLHRLEAAKKLEWTEIPGCIFTDKALDVELAEIDENLIRADLTYQEHCHHLARRKEIYEGRHPETKHGAQGGGRQGKGTRSKTETPESGVSVPSFAEDTAAKVGKGKSTIHQEIQIDNNLDEGIKEQISETNLADSKTDLLKLSKMEPSEQRRIVERIVNGDAKSVKDVQLQDRKAAITAQSVEASRQKPPIVQCADALDWLNGQPECDLLLTDPPYSTEIPDIAAFARSWLPLALSKVKPTGRAYVCIGAYPEELLAYLSVSLPKQVLVWTYRNTLGPSPKQGYKANWQAILYYEGAKAGPLDCSEMLEQFSVQDIVAPDGRQGDRYHTWQKPTELGERFVRHATKAGERVIDPFCCTGSFLLAAASLGRVAEGCDISQEWLDIAIERGCRLAP